MEFASFPYLEDAGTDWESQEEASVIVVPYGRGQGQYYVVNAHRGDHARFEVNSEEVDALLEALHWIKDHALAHPVERPEPSEQENADEPNPVEEDG